MLDESLRSTNTMVVETFDNNCHVFNLISSNNKHYFQYENIKKYIDKIIIKPDLWVFYVNGGYEQGVKLLKPIFKNVKKVLARNFYIDPEIFNTLIKEGLIVYSKAMADLYDLPIEFSKDYSIHTRDYKHSKNKELVLTKLKNGIFN